MCIRKMMFVFDLFIIIDETTFTSCQPYSTLGGGGGGGGDSTLFQIVFFITSVRDAAEPRNLVTFPKI